MTDYEADTISEAQAAQSKPSHRPRVPFPAAGPDAVFYFTLGALGALEKAADAIVPDWGGRGFTFFGLFERLLLDGNPAAVRAVIDAGLKREVDGKVVPLAEIDLDAIEWPISEVVEPALNALAISVLGKSYSDLLAEATAAAEARAAEARAARGA